MGDGNLFIFIAGNNIVTSGGICLVEIILSIFLSVDNERGVSQLLQRRERVHRQRRLLYSDDEDGMEAIRVL